jgi:hypothetical protein
MPRSNLHSALLFLSWSLQGLRLERVWRRDWMCTFEHQFWLWLASENSDSSVLNLNTLGVLSSHNMNQMEQ